MFLPCMSWVTSLASIKAAQGSLLSYGHGYGRDRMLYYGQIQPSASCGKLWTLTAGQTSRKIDGRSYFQHDILGRESGMGKNRAVR